MAFFLNSSLVTPVTATNGMYYAFYHSDLMGQGICVVLFIFSMVVWTVMIEKLTSLRRMELDTDKFIRLFKEKRNPLALRDKIDGDPSPGANIYRSACERIESFKIDNAFGGRRALSDDELSIVKSAMEQSVEDNIISLEKRMMFLATAVSASPFLGLFGTVWGITIAFTNLAQQGRADIQTLAPGVSGALLTTVIALFVAIPSLVGYNIITTKIKSMTVKFDNFVDEIHSRLKIEQLDSYRAAGSGNGGNGGN